MRSYFVCTRRISVSIPSCRYHVPANPATMRESAFLWDWIMNFAENKRTLTYLPLISFESLQVIVVIATKWTIGMNFHPFHGAGGTHTVCTRKHNLIGLAHADATFRTWWSIPQKRWPTNIHYFRVSTKQHIVDAKIWHGNDWFLLCGIRYGTCFWSLSNDDNLLLTCSNEMQIS